MHTDSASTPTILPRRIAVFFYGSFIRREVMARGGLQAERIDVARLTGFDIHVDPHACITRSDQHSIYGILVHASHEELDKLYTMDGVGIFLPEAVVVETDGGRLQAAMCYIPPARRHQPADLDYLALLVAAARGHGFPDWYVERLAALAR